MSVARGRQLKPVPYGKVVGRLTVMCLSESTCKGSTSKFKYWCYCECGNVVEISAGLLRRNSVQSCGCLKKEQMSEMFSTHHMTNTRVYAIWCGMKQRCQNKNDYGFKKYGAAGITVSDEWSKSFEKFFEDMGDCSLDQSLDRIDTLKGYSKDNCRWASRSEQTINCRIRSHNTSGRTGVKWLERLGKWQADIMYDGGKYVYGGVFLNFEDAVAAREMLEITYHGKVRPSNYEVTRGE